MPLPTQQQLDQWWNGLQTTLNQANADIDLNNPADLIRFRITEITNKNPAGRDADVTAYFPFAEDKNMNMAQVTDEQLIAAQQPGKPSTEKLTELYIAAKEGRLYVNSLQERKTAPRQVIVNKSGDPEVWPDYQHGTAEMKIAERTLMPPKKPKEWSAGIWNRIAAFFGNKKAKQECQKVDRRNERDKQKYEKDKAVWEQAKNMDPDFIVQVQNQIYSVDNYFQKTYDEDIMINQFRLHQLSFKAHKQPLIDEVVAQTKRYETAAAEKLSDMMKTSSEVTPEARDLIAEICYQRMLGKHIQDQFENDQKTFDAGICNMTEDSIVRSAHEATAGSKPYQILFDKTCGSESFTRAIKELSVQDVKAFAENPQAAADAVYAKCTTNAQKIAKQMTMEKSAAAMKGVQVKGETKDFTATANRPHIDSVKPKPQSKEAEPHR